MGCCGCPWIATLHESYTRFAPYKNSRRNMNYEGKERGEGVWSPAPPPESRTQQRRAYSQQKAYQEGEKKNKCWTRRFLLLFLLFLLLFLLFVFRRILTTAKLKAHNPGTKRTNASPKKTRTRLCRGVQPAARLLKRRQQLHQH